MKTRTVLLSILGLCLFLVLSLWLAPAGLNYINRNTLNLLVPANVTQPDIRADFRLIAEAWSKIDTYYVDRQAIKPREMTYGAIGGMVDALGDTGHSRFLSPDMVASLQEFTHDQFKGIGAEVQMKSGHVVIVAPMEGSPAQKAGLQPGDMILRVDGQDITGVPLDKVVEKITGPVGTTVTLTILSPSSGRTRDVTITRASITIQNVTWQHLPGTPIAHLHISGFGGGVTDHLVSALKQIEQEQLTGLVLDLRNNPGGILDEVIGVSSQFLKGGPIVLIKNAKGQVAPLEAKPGGMALSIPIVVLINEGSASGSEILSGALKDRGRATLVGEKTFGTGTVLAEFSLSDGSALLLAVEEWLTPDGHVIWHKGIEPNEKVALPSDISPLFPEAERNMTADQLQASGDAQLLRAVQILSQSAEASPRPGGLAFSPTARPDDPNRRSAL